MPTYSFRCTACGEFAVRCPIAERAGPHRCPTCARPGIRVYDAPALRAMAGPLRGALESAERSADAPETVTSVPRSSRATPVTRDPRHLSLPRP
ncbi:MAG: FmdB family zinc ribbon protein [Pseudonocardia sp.]